MRLNLRTRLTLGFLVAILATGALVALLANFITVNRFRNLVSLAGYRYADRLVPVFVEYHVQAGGWNGVDALMESIRGMPRGPKPPDQGMEHMMLRSGMVAAGEERLLLLDADGEIIADSDPQGSPLNLSADNLSKGIPILVDGQQVGTLLVSSSLGRLTTYQSSFLRQVNGLLLAATAAAVLAVLVASAYQAQRIVEPVRALASAARRVSTGDFSQRIPVTSQDELGEMATAFNTMAAELERQQGLRHRAMADIAHELRTPLSVLQIALESIEDGLTHPTPEVITGLQTDVAHLHRLVEDLRTLSQADAGELQMEAEPVEMGGLVRDVVNRVQGTARAKKIDLAAQLPDTPLPVTGDTQRLAQVLLNLLSNALQHTPAEGRVAVSGRRVGQEVHVVVQDTGEGILPKDLPHIFERFYRADRARSSGLGLSITHSLIEAHGGRIWAESVRGEGSTFTFALPLTDEA